MLDDARMEIKTKKQEKIQDMIYKGSKNFGIRKTAD